MAGSVNSCGSYLSFLELLAFSQLFMLLCRSDSFISFISYIFKLHASSFSHLTDKKAVIQKVFRKITEKKLMYVVHIFCILYRRGRAVCHSLSISSSLNQQRYRYHSLLTDNDEEFSVFNRTAYHSVDAGSYDSWKEHNY